jgi:hypothetical protein
VRLGWRWSGRLGWWGNGRWDFKADVSFAPAGLVSLLLNTHGLRRGLHSSAASRLGRLASVSEVEADIFAAAN